MNDKFYSLIPLADFKGILGVDDRDDRLTRYCLVTATHTIEEYCMRRLLKKQLFEIFELFDDLKFTLREFPVGKILAAFLMNNEQGTINNGELLDPKYYRVNPDCGSDVDIPYSIEFSHAIKKMRCNSVKVAHQAGYSIGNVPPDLSSACLELASWNFNRYKAHRIGITGNIRGSGKDGEHFETSMPENVKQLLEPYRRKTI